MGSDNERWMNQSGYGDDKDVWEEKIVSWIVSGKNRNISELLFLNLLMWRKYGSILNK